MWFIGVEEEQETSAPPPKKNPGSAPDNLQIIISNIQTNKNKFNDKQDKSQANLILGFGMMWIPVRPSLNSPALSVGDQQKIIFSPHVISPFLVLLGRICLKIKLFWFRWSFLLFSNPSMLDWTVILLGEIRLWSLLGFTLSLFLRRVGFQNQINTCYLFLNNMGKLLLSFYCCLLSLLSSKTLYTSG